MATEKTDFLRFNAYSMKELITRKMSEDSKFTDQIYEGSNLAILIDLVAYMYQVLVYQLNNAASESMFSDTQVYENIARLVKMIGYHPQGFIPSRITVYLNKDESVTGESIGIPLFARLDTGLTDSRGKTIYFSTVDPDTDVSNNDSIQIPLYNGQWKMYPQVFKAMGVDNETFILDGVSSDSDDGKYVANEQFRILVKSRDGEYGKLSDWKYERENIFVKQSGLDNDTESSFAKLYTGSDRIFNAYINENKTYEIRFGNGVSGAKLNRDDQVYVFYLETNGPDGEVDPAQVDVDKGFEHNRQMFGMSQEMYDAISEFKIKIPERSDYELYLDVNSVMSSKKEEDVQTIRENAPEWFKVGNRLVSKRDYEYYIKSCWSDVVDVKCINNWEYLNSFYKWLYKCGMSPNPFIGDWHRTRKPDGGRTYIEQFRMESLGYKFIDPADACNLYMVVELTDNARMESFNAEIDERLENLKTLTTEIYAFSPVQMQFQVCASDMEVESLRIVGDGMLGRNYIEITLEDNIMYVASVIQRMVADVIYDFFKKENRRIGEVVDFNKILQQIYAINGVQRVRTVFEPLDFTKYTEVVVNGLSFSSFSNTDLVQAGEDLQISTSSRSLEVFQFPVLGYSREELLDHITVIKKQLSNINPIKF